MAEKLTGVLKNNGHPALKKEGIGIFFKIIIIAIIGLLLFLCAITATPLLKNTLSFYLASRLGADVNIKKASLAIDGTLNAEDIKITSKTGFSCAIREAKITYMPALFLKKIHGFKFSLEKIEFSNPNSKIIESITGIFSLDPKQVFSFDTANGELFINSGELITKQVYAAGKDMRLYADGTIKRDESLNYTLKLWFSQYFTSRMPESFRSIFFKKDAEFSLVQLYLKGSLKKPSINFSTPLFKLRVD